MSPASARALAGKEFHHLLPLIFAMLALEVVGILDWFVAQSPDEISWANVSLLLDPGLATVAASIYVIVGVVTAYMLFPHERDRNTLQFLWGLPVSRGTIYVIKLATGFVVLSVLLVIGHLLLWWMHTFSVNSISVTQFSWQLWSLELATLIGLTAISLGYGALIACFRIIGVLGFILLLTAAQVIAYMDPSYAYLDILDLLTPEYRGTEILLNSKGWLLHSTLGLGCAVFAGVLWTRDGQPPADRKTFKRLGSRIGAGLLMLLTLGAIILYGTTQLGPNLTDPELTGSKPTNQLETITTQYYEISHYAEDRTYAQLLEKEADLRAQQVQALLGATVTELILADLTDNSADHLGIAGWKKLRIGQSALYDSEQRSHVFVHETAHVVASAASNRRLQDHASYTGFFSEGLAEWVSYEILGLEAQRHALRLLAALAWRRFDLRIDDFVFGASFRARFDENLIYALGEAWVSTLADVCGKQAPGDVLQAMARPNAPQQLQGNGFWRELLQASGCDITAVNGRFALSMRAYQSQLTTVPALNGAIQIQDEQLVVTLSLEGSELDETYRVFVRLRDNPSTSPAAMYTESAQLQPGNTVSLEVPWAMLAGERFQYQLGVEFLQGERPFFGAWIDAG